MNDTAEPVPGKSGTQTSGQFDSGEWRKEAAAGKYPENAEIFFKRFNMGGELGDRTREIFGLIASSDQTKVIEGLKALPDEKTRFAALETFLAFHAARPPYFSPEDISK